MIKKSVEKKAGVIEVVLKLVIKDFRANLFPILNFFLINSLGGMLIFCFFSWDAYYFHCVAITIITIARLNALEMKDRKEALWTSIPAKRGDIVLSRYVSSYIIVIAGLVLWYLAANLWNVIFTNPGTDFEQLKSVYHLISSVFMFSLFISMFIPAVFKINSYPMLIGSAATFMILTFTVSEIFLTDEFSINNALNNYGAANLLLILAVLILLMITVSILLSRRFYSFKEF